MGKQFDADSAGVFLPCANVLEFVQMSENRGRGSTKPTRHRTKLREGVESLTLWSVRNMAQELRQGDLYV